MEILDLGVRSYAEVLSFQRALAADRISGALPHFCAGSTNVCEDTGRAVAKYSALPTILTSAGDAYTQHPR